MLLDIIEDFVKLEGISTLKWEILVTMSPSMIRGSLSSAYPIPRQVSDLALSGLPDVQDAPLDPGLMEVFEVSLTEDLKTITNSLTLTHDKSTAERIASEYARAIENRLRILSLKKSRLLEEAFRSPDIANTGVCGETANLLARMIGGTAITEILPMAGFVEAFNMEDIPRSYVLISIGKSHKFLVEKTGKDIALLQSWIGRFSLTKWLNDGKKRWTLPEFADALTTALPPVKTMEEKVLVKQAEAYNLLFNVPDVERTPSCHVASEVTGEVYLSPDKYDETVRNNLRQAYEEGLSRWKD